MNWPAVIESNATASVGIRAKNSKTDVKHHRLAARLKNIPDRIELLVARIKTLIRRMKFKADDLRIEYQLLSIARDLGYICSIDVQGCENSGEGIWKSAYQVDDMVVGVFGSFRNRGGMPPDQQGFDVLLDIKVGKSFRCSRHFVEIASEVIARMRIEAACAWVNVNVNGSHAPSSVPCRLVAKD